MKFVTAWFIVAIALTASAQTQPAGLPPIAPPTTQAATPAATPAPQPVVGMNVDASTAQPAPTQTTQPQPPYQQQTPPSNAQANEEMQRRLMENMSRPRGAIARPQNSPVSANPVYPQNEGGGEQKSEIIPVLPPAERPPELRAVLRTSVGDITVRLDRVNAPHTVDYFTGIAKGDISFTDIKTSKPVKRPFYNGLIFHRVVKNTLIQTGDPFANGRGNSGQTIPDELKPTMKFDRPGLVAMAPMRDSSGTKISKNTNSSQFFITLREMPEWNGDYTIFGEVEDGLDVVQKIANAKVGPTERPIKRIYLVAVDILDVGNQPSK